MSISEFVEEFSGCDFGDERLSKRVRTLAESLSQHPNQSIPAALKSHADIEACYRFFDNHKVTPERILEPHEEATRERIRQVDFALLVQDTTEIDLTRPKKQVAGAGPMDSGSRRGAFCHSMVAFDATGIPLGIIDETCWTRESISKKSKSEKRDARRKIPIEEKESYRWLRGIRQAEATAAACPDTTCVCVGDSESDIYEVFAEAVASNQNNLHLLVRAGQNRNTTNQQDWLDQARKTKKIGEQTVKVRARDAKVGQGKSARSRTREARMAKLETRKSTIEVRRPISGNRSLPASLILNVVLCEEVKPPEGVDPISWMLVTTLPIDTKEDAQSVIAAYCVRWQIEIFFRTLKSGCRVEHRRFEAMDRVLNCLALYSVIAWRVMYVCYLGRQCPDLDCEVLFEPSEWKAVYAILENEFPDGRAPTLHEMVRAVANLGGFIDRPKNNPGTQTLWIGMQRMYDMSNAWNAFGPGSKKIFAGENV